MLFALNATREYGEAVSRNLGIRLSPHEEREFEDGEHKTRPLVNVRGHDVFVVQSLYADAAASINDKLVRLLFFVGALRDASAASVTAIVPYLSYARQDRRVEAGDPITTRYTAALFEAAGADRVVALDIHNRSAFDNAFRCRTVHLEATGLFVEHFAKALGRRDITVVSPDSGGVARAERFRAMLAKRLGRPVGSALMEKFRTDGAITGEAFAGDVRERVAIIFDDMISTASTVARAARVCHERGAVEVFAAATHGLFAGRAAALLLQAKLQGIVVTDSVPSSRLDAVEIDTDVTILETAPLVAAAIKQIQADDSLAALTSV